jgi:ABC-type Na+ efflux pump permease subunit
MGHLAKKGAVLGLVTGLVALLGVFEVSVRCLPFHISVPTHPWPWYCSDPAYGIIVYLAFPVNLLTNDLSQAVRFVPLSLLLYTVLGAFIGSRLESPRSSLPGGQEKR